MTTTDPRDDDSPFPPDVGEQVWDDPDGPIYDAQVAPEADDWLALDEGERMLLVEDHHTRIGDALPTEEQRRLHAIAHVIVENQLAEDAPPEARQTLARLLDAGMDRHAAVHAIGNEVVTLMHELRTSGEPLQAGQYEQALHAIDPADWIRSASD